MSEAGRAKWVRRAAVLAVAIGLFAGPAAAACTACCPDPGAPQVVVATPACCGDCGPSVGRGPEPASTTAKTFATPTPLLLADTPSPNAAGRPSTPLLWCTIERCARLGPGAATPPLRL